MEINKPLTTFWLMVLLAFTSCATQKRFPTAAPPEKAAVKVDWDKAVTVSKTSATLQVVVNPPLRPGSKIVDPVYQSVKDLGCDYVRYVPWLPYPKLGVAELEAPKRGVLPGIFPLLIR